MHSWISRAGPSVDAGQAAWHGSTPPPSFSVSTSVIKKRYTHLYVSFMLMRKSCPVMHLQQRQHQALTTVHYLKENLIDNCPKAAALYPKHKVILWLLCLAPHNTYWHILPERLPLRSSKSNTNYRYTGIQIKHLLTVEHGEIYFETILWYT